MVHDSARVFRFFDGELFFRLRLDVEADQLDSPDRQEFMKQFDSSYETIEETNGVKYRYFDHVKDGNQPRMASWSTRSRGLRRSGLRARAQSMPDRHPGLWSGRYRRPVECELGAARTCTAVEVRASRAARDDVAGPLASMVAVCLKRRMRDCLTPSPCRVDVAIRGRFRWDPPRIVAAPRIVVVQG